MSVALPGYITGRGGSLRLFSCEFSCEVVTVFVKALRVGLGQLVIFADFLTRPAKQKRSPQAQAAVELSAKNLSLYQFQACPFCVKTRRALHRLNVPVTLRDAKNNEQDRQMLLKEGGKIKVPCLRIEQDGKTVWMYESSAIIAYLDQRFAAA